MLQRVAYLLVLVICEVNCYYLSESKWISMDNKTIQLKEYCDNNVCVVKCCPDHHMIAKVKNVTKCIQPKKLEFIEKINYTKHLHSNFVFVKNDMLSNPDLAISFVGCKFHIKEDGSLVSDTRSPDLPCRDAPKLQFCIGFEYVTQIDSAQPDVVFMYRALNEIDPDADVKTIYTVTGTLISAFFMVMVIIVYRLIRELQNFKGAMIQAYLVSLTVAYIIRALLHMIVDEIDDEVCRHLSPALYYFYLASFFWLNIMSFDLWSTVRKYRLISSQREKFNRVKFVRYCFYAWGIPALLTAFVVLVDRLKFYSSEKYRPPFSKCFAEDGPRKLYMDLPIFLVAAINCILFLMTAYNMWMTEKGVTANKESRSTRKLKDRFIIYINISVMMGVSWMLELISGLPLAAHIIVNFLNIFIGIPLFIILVCKKSILIKLCKRLNIKSKYLDNQEPSMYSISEIHARGNRTSHQRQSSDSGAKEKLTHKVSMEP